ncbi:MAG: hypothetical protein GQ574_19135 [Crocinitomix sp.]|nr:hypothetical protein [Crocinitomix sp.]
MKFSYRSIFALILLLIITSSCIKNHRCIRQNEKAKHVVKLSELPAQELRDTLEKYDNLTVTRVLDNEFSKGIHCNVYYKGFLIIADKYRLFKGTNSGNIWSPDTIPTYIDVVLENELSRKEALRIAQELEDYGAQCIRAQLGILDISNFTSAKEEEYKMVWDITGWSGGPRVMIDANSSKVYYHY